MSRYRLSRDLDDQIVLERVEILFVGWADALGEILELLVFEKLIDDLVFVKVEVEGSERTRT